MFRWIDLCVVVLITGQKGKTFCGMYCTHKEPDEPSQSWGIYHPVRGTNATPQGVPKPHNVAVLSVSKSRKAMITIVVEFPLSMASTE